MSIYLKELMGSLSKPNHKVYKAAPDIFSVTDLCVSDVCKYVNPCLKCRTQNSHWRSNLKNSIIQIESQGADFQFYSLKFVQGACYNHFDPLSGISISLSPFQLAGSPFLLKPRDYWSSHRLGMVSVMNQESAEEQGHFIRVSQNVLVSGWNCST